MFIVVLLQRKRFLTLYLHKAGPILFSLIEASPAAPLKTALRSTTRDRTACASERGLAS